MLKKIECFLQPSKLEEVKDELVKVGAEGMSVNEVRGFGRQRGYLEGEKINKEVKFLPKIKVEIVVDEEIVDRVIGRIRELCRSNTIGGSKDICPSSGGCGKNKDGRSGEKYYLLDLLT